jgi:hypothetical protein
MDNARPHYRLTVRAEPGWPGTPESRLRRFLKAALRAFGLRCTEIEALPVPPSKAKSKLRTMDLKTQEETRHG